MILLIDAGNTLIKWRLVQAADTRAIIDEGALEHGDVAELAGLRSRHPQLEHIVASNVASADLAARIVTALAPVRIHWLRSSSQCAGVRNLYDSPTQLGADRWAALIGAHSLHPHACLVVTAGTATTVDLLAANGDFLGGLILPGVELMQHALARGTAQLPRANGHYSPMPRNTEDAIHSGCVQAQAGAVERMFEQIAAEPDALCLLGGGAAASIADLLRIPVKRVHNLVLHGLGTVAATEANGGLSPDRTLREESATAAAFHPGDIASSSHRI